MEKIAVSEFRANMVSLLKKVEKGEVFTLTSRGHEVAKIVPPDDRMEEARKTLRHLRKTAVIGDVLSPIEDGWKAMQ